VLGHLEQKQTKGNSCCNTRAVRRRGERTCQNGKKGKQVAAFNLLKRIVE